MCQNKRILWLLEDEYAFKKISVKKKIFFESEQPTALTLPRNSKH